MGLIQGIARAAKRPCGTSFSEADWKRVRTDWEAGDREMSDIFLRLAAFVCLSGLSSALFAQPYLTIH
jgi:hypothetical protein